MEFLTCLREKLSGFAYADSPPNMWMSIAFKMTRLSQSSVPSARISRVDPTAFGSREIPSTPQWLKLGRNIVAVACRTGVHQVTGHRSAASIHTRWRNEASGLGFLQICSRPEYPFVKLPLTGLGLQRTFASKSPEWSRSRTGSAFWRRFMPGAHEKKRPVNDRPLRAE